MSDTSDWTGRRIGPYQVGARYRGIPENEGRLYAAHHTGTGEPAVVVMPGAGEEWRTLTSWSVTTTSFTDPSALVLQAVRSPQSKAASLHEMTLGHIRAVAALSTLDERRDVRDHFTSKLPALAFRRRRRVRWGLVGVGVALTVGGLLMLWLYLLGSTGLHPQRDGMALATHDESIIFGDMRSLTTPTAVSYLMPERPSKTQKTPPCIPITEVELRGGCWTQHKLDAPCPPGTAEYEDKCYNPSKKQDPEPNPAHP